MLRFGAMMLGRSTRSCSREKTGGWDRSCGRRAVSGRPFVPRAPQGPLPSAQLPNPTRGICGTRAGGGSVATSGVPLADFARNLAPLTGRFVVDRTGLTGPYDLDLKWTADRVAADRPAGALTDGTSLFAAVQEQLGLELEPQRAPVDVLVIESAEQPVED
jgi:uncharacterized protein (TIGR03435 family)